MSFMVKPHIPIPQEPSAKSHYPWGHYKFAVQKPLNNYINIDIDQILYFFVKGKRIIALHGIRNKAKKIALKDRKVALGRKRDWLERNLVWNEKLILIDTSKSS